MKFADFLFHFPDVEMTKHQMNCCRKLEREGKRFLVDFGYENAPDLCKYRWHEDLEPTGWIN